MNKVYCCHCGKDIDARQTTGKEIYPHRKDLYHLKFVICDVCKNYKAMRNDEAELFIPSKEVREYRLKIHAILDPLWKSRKIKRGKAYAYISHRFGKTYHNSQIRTTEEAKKAYEIVCQLRDSILTNTKDE